MGMITSTKSCAVTVMVRNSQNEASFQPVNYVNDLNKVKNAVLRDSAREEPQFGTKCYGTLASNEKEEFSPKMKMQRKH